MNSVMNKGKITGFCLSLLLSTSIQAEEFSAKLGAVAIESQDYIIGEDNSSKVLPFLSLEYGMFSLGQDGLALTYEMDDNNTVSAALNQRESEFDRGDNNRLRHFDKRYTATDLTLSWAKKIAAGDLTFSVTNDVSDTYDGYELGAEFSKMIPALGGIVIPSVSVNLQSDKLVDYYYGVKSQEATTDIKEYKAKESVNTALSVTHVYIISDHWSTLTNLSWEHLGSGISDSPIVKKDDVWTIVMGVVYDF